jgi:hypothetical protein
MKHDPEEWNRWCEFAMLCEGPVDDTGHSRDLDDGLCWTLHLAGIEHRDPMVLRLEAHRPHGSGELSYWWPHTRWGWDARARFCWMMAAEREAEESR